MKLAEDLLYFLAKRMSSSEVAHNDEMKSALETDEAYAKYRLSLVKIVTDAAQQYDVPIKNKVVLDLGCYDGAISLGYLEYGARKVIGVDIDSDAVAIAKSQNAGENVEFFNSTTGSIPLDDNSVDTIVCYDVFEHMANPAEMLLDIHRVLKPEGQILIGTTSWKNPFAPHLWSTMPVPYVHIFFSEKTILRTCKRVYHSDWYKPTFHDLDENGNLKQGKYEHEEIPLDYLNKYTISDFEKVCNDSPLDSELHLQPFGSRYASWTRMFLGIPWIREFITGYLWIVLTKPVAQVNQQADLQRPVAITAQPETV